MRVAILTEDGAKSAHEAIEGLTRASFRVLITETPQTQRMAFVPAAGPAREVMLANQWKNKKRKKLVELIRYIATELVRGGFVFFHCDGDATWSAREESPNRAHFEHLIRARVRNYLLYKHPSTDADRTMTRLHLMMPFWCIESWLYQNTVVALRLCRDRGLDADRALFEAWAADRTLLDEVKQPKDQTKLADHGNAELAKAYPADAVYDQSPSFTAFIDELLADDALIAALRATAL